MWVKAVQAKFPIPRMRAALAIYRHTRIVRYGNAVTESFAICSSIIAGCGLATTVLKAYMICAVDHFMLRARAPDLDI